MTTAERTDRRTEASDLRMEVRVANLEGLKLANAMRTLGRRLQFVAIRDESPEAHQLGLEVEARANRYVRQRPIQ